jgi:hypothetical protein
LSKKSEIYNLYFNLKKSTVEIATELDVSKQYVSKILQTNYSEEHEDEKVNRKKINKEKREAKKYDAEECNYKYRDRPLMPNETMTTLNFVKWNSHSFITDKNGKMHFDKSRGGVTKNIPVTYTPII